LSILLLHPNCVTTVLTLRLYFRDATGKFPDFPDEDEGGSAGIFKQKTPEEVEAELNNKVVIIRVISPTHFSYHWLSNTLFTTAIGYYLMVVGFVPAIIKLPTEN